MDVRRHPFHTKLLLRTCSVILRWIQLNCLLLGCYVYVLFMSCVLYSLWFLACCICHRKYCGVIAVHCNGHVLTVWFMVGWWLDSQADWQAPLCAYLQDLYLDLFINDLAETMHDDKSRNWLHWILGSVRIVWLITEADCLLVVYIANYECGIT